MAGLYKREPTDYQQGSKQSVQEQVNTISCFHSVTARSVHA